jgi:hypothetical protein
MPMDHMRRRQKQSAIDLRSWIRIDHRRHPMNDRSSKNMKGWAPMTDQELVQIPQPREKPLIGNLLALDRTAPIQGFVKLAHQYGPIYQLKLRGNTLIVVSGASLMDELCDQSRFAKSVDGALLKVRAFAANGLFTARTSDPDW